MRNVRAKTWEAQSARHVIRPPWWEGGNSKRRERVMLGGGCLRGLSREESPLPSAWAKDWVFVNVPKWAYSGVQEWVLTTFAPQNPLVDPLVDPFRTSIKTHL